MTTSRKTTKLFIPHTHEQNVNIAGILEQVEPDQDTRGRKIALILHGLIGHKDYLYQRNLALQLPLDSFRFDFRGNNETPGSWGMGAFPSDLQDLQIVVAYLTSHYGYQIDLLVGHSRGGTVGLRWMCIAKEAKSVSAFVIVSSRYRMERAYIDVLPQFKASFDKIGYHDWVLNVARQPVTKRIYPKDLDEFAAWDTSLIWTDFPRNTHVLTIHGIADKLVPVYDSIIHARALGARSPGTHNLCLIENSDHNHIGNHDFIVSTVLEWLGKLRQGSLRTGIWNTGVQGRL